jgi:hypothetical protein
MAFHRPGGGLLCYDVLIHVDHITHFRPTAEASAEWPQQHSFCWRLGFHDDWALAVPRRTVQDRLGMRKRDRSPPSGAGGDATRNGGGAGRRHVVWIPRRNGSSSPAGTHTTRHARCHVRTGHVTHQSTGPCKSNLATSRHAPPPSNVLCPVQSHSHGRWRGSICCCPQPRRRCAPDSRSSSSATRQASRPSHHCSNPTCHLTCTRSAMRCAARPHVFGVHTSTAY